MNTESRREFEEWAESDNYFTGKKADGNYEFISTHIAWKIWQAARERQWMPIETAPKDGTEIMVISNRGYIHIVTYHPRAEWYSADADQYCGGITHWMPLPNPPASEKI